MLGFLGGSPDLVAHLALQAISWVQLQRRDQNILANRKHGVDARYEVSKRGSDPMKGLDLLAIWPSMRES